MPGAITTDLTLIDAAEATTNWATIGTWGANPAASTDIFLEQANAINARASAAVGPVERTAWSHVATAAGLDLTISQRHLYFWVKCFSLPALNTRAKGGIRVSISSDTTPTKTGTDPWSGATNSKQWFVSGKDFEPESGWVCYVVDPTGVSDLDLGSPAMASVDRAGIGTDALLIVGGGAVKPLPVIWDRIAYGSSLTINNGTSGSPVMFEDIYTADSQNGNQYGILRKAIGIYLCAGKLLFGTTGQSAITYFKDTNQVLVWQDFRQNNLLYEIKMAGAASFVTTFQLGTFSGGLTSGGCVIRGSGLNTRRAVAPVIVSGGTGYTANDILTVSGGTSTIAAQVKVIAVSGGVITDLKIETAGSYSIPPTGTLTLTGGTGNSGTCTLTFVGGSVWTLTADAANQTTNLYGCSFSEMLSAAFTTTSAIRGCSFDNCGQITVGGATLDGNTFQNLRTISPISASYQLSVSTTTPVLTNNKFVNCATALFWNQNADTNTKLDSSSFYSGGTGHAIEFGTNTPTEISLTSVLFSGYGSDGTADAAIYNNSGHALTINILGTGNAPTVRNGTGASTTIVAGTVTTTVTVKDINTGSVIVSAQVLVTASDNTGPMPFEETVSTITRVDTTATVSHTGHGLINGKQTLIKGADQPEYNGVKTITFIDANSYSYTVSGSPTTPATGTIKSTGVVISGVTNGSGIISDTRTHASNQPITGRVRKATGGTLYKTGSISGIINSSTGFSVTVQLIPDS